MNAVTKYYHQSSSNESHAKVTASDFLLYLSHVNKTNTKNCVSISIVSTLLQRGR